MQGVSGLWYNLGPTSSKRGMAEVWPNGTVTFSNHEARGFTPWHWGCWEGAKHTSINSIQRMRLTEARPALLLHQQRVWGSFQKSLETLMGAARVRYLFMNPFFYTFISEPCSFIISLPPHTSKTNVPFLRGEKAYQFSVTLTYKRANLSPAALGSRLQKDSSKLGTTTLHCPFQSILPIYP